MRDCSVTWRAVLVIALGLVIASAPAEAKKPRKPSACETGCAGLEAADVCRSDCKRLRPKCKGPDCKSAVVSCAGRCATTWPNTGDAKSRGGCLKKCKACLTRKVGERGVCPSGRDLQCCNGPGEPACCGEKCCGAGELCCTNADPSLPGQCVDVLNEPKNCGTCNHLCSTVPLQKCSDGHCVDAEDTCPAGKYFCGSLNNLAGASGCCDLGQVCCPLAQAAYLCSDSGMKCCDFPSAQPRGVIQFPCPGDATCCGGIAPGGQTTVGCCPPGYACGTDSGGAMTCQLQ